MSTQTAVLVDRTTLITGCLIVAALCLLSAVTIIVLSVKLSRAEGRGPEYRRMKQAAREAANAWAGAHVVLGIIVGTLDLHADIDTGPALAARIRHVIDVYRQGKNNT